MRMHPLPLDDCSRTVQRLSLRLDDELSELESALLDAHLRACSGCRAVGERLEGARDALRGAVPEEPAQPFTLPRRGRIGAYVLRSVPATAATAAVFLVSIFVGLTGLVRPYIPPARVGAPEVRAARQEMGVKNELLNELEATRWSKAIRPSLAAAQQTALTNSPTGARAPSLSTGQFASEGR